MDLTGPVVVTGAGGLLGGQVAWTFAQQGVDVYAFTRSQLDVSDLETVRRRFESTRPSVVVHCAAMTNVDRCEEEPEAAHAANAEGSANVAAAALDVAAEVVNISTDYVFDGERGSYSESDPTNPIQVYGRTKLEGEERTRQNNPMHYIIRSAWIYGPGGKNFPSKLPELAKMNQTITAVTDQRGSPTYAPDLADAITWIVGSGKYGTYHVVNQGVCSFAEFFEYGVASLRADLKVEHVTLADLGRPAPRPHDTSLVDDFWRASGFPALRPWQEAANAFLSAEGH